MSDRPTILHLPNCVLIQLLSYLDATSLYHLSQTCERLSEIVKGNRKLWRYIDARRGPNNEEKLGFCLARGHSDTTALLIRGSKKDNPLIQSDFFMTIESFKSLQVVALENQSIDGFTITAFPENLQELSLKRTTVKTQDFFRHSSNHMKELRVLVLDECNWVSSSDLMSLAKYKKLEILSLYNCVNFDNSIAYFSLAGRGFKNLKVFDARLTSMGNGLLHSIYKSQSLLAIYFQNKDLSYDLDCLKRKLEISRGAPIREYLEIEKADDTTRESNDSFNENSFSLDDTAMFNYANARSSQLETEYPKSCLYTDPYTVCTCGYDKRGKKKQKKHPLRKKSSDGDDSDDDDDNDDFGPLQDVIAKMTETIHERPSCNSSNVQSYSARIPPDNSIVINVSHTFSPIPHRHFRRINVNHDNHNQENVPEENHHNSQNRISCVYTRKRGSQEDDSLEVKKAKIDDQEATPGPSREDNAVLPPEPQKRNEAAQAPPPLNVPDAWRLEDFIPIRCLAFRGPNAARNMVVQMARVQFELSVPLKRFSLRGYKSITNRALELLKNIDLEILDLTYTSVTFEGICDYLIDHPSCRVVHKEFCVCPTVLHF